jgi:fumarate reductase flavoprotein subunit
VRTAELRAPDEAAIARAIAIHEAPLARPAQSLEPIREALYACMWDDVGILRTASGLRRGASRLGELARALEAAGAGGSERAFSLAWHDWMNLRNLIEVSRVIVAAALAREDSRGAHYREDHPDSGDLARSTYTVARRVGTEVAIEREPVRFTRVEPGESLLPPRTPPFRPAANMQ